MVFCQSGALTLWGEKSLMYLRQDTRPVKVGNLTIGGSNEVIIQSMCTTKTADVEATVAEILRLEEAGCQVVRVTVNNEEAAARLRKSRSGFTSRSWQIFILTTSLPCLLSRMALIKFGSIQVTSVNVLKSKRSSRRVRKRGFRFESG